MTAPIESYGHFILDSPPVLSSVGSFGSISPPVSYTDNYLNKDLLNDDLDDLYETLSKIPILERSPIQLEQTTGLTIQSIMVNPSLILEFISCFTFNLFVCGNVFMFSILNTESELGLESIVRYVLIIVINVSLLGMITFICAGPDTFRSVNITLAYLSINAIFYKYSFINYLRYLFIHFVAALLAALISIGMYNDVLKDISTSDIQKNMFALQKPISFSYSFALITLVAHACLSLGIMVLVSMTTSINARARAIHKAILIFFISITFGVVIGPIGYSWPILTVYSMLLIVRNDYEEFNLNMFATCASTIIVIVILYPILALQIKYTWRNRYSKYVEYLL